MHVIMRTRVYSSLNNYYHYRGIPNKNMIPSVIITGIIKHKNQQLISYSIITLSAYQI